MTSVSASKADLVGASQYVGKAKSENRSGSRIGPLPAGLLRLQQKFQLAYGNIHAQDGREVSPCPAGWLARPPEVFGLCAKMTDLQHLLEEI